MEQVFNDRFDYLGFGVHKSFCNVEIYKEDDKYIVIMTEPHDESSGTSVTNACEDIATKLYNDGYFEETYPGNIVWVEHYSRERGFDETYDQINLEFAGKGIGNVKFAHPTWKHIGEKLTDEDVRELLK